MTSRPPLDFPLQVQTTPSGEVYTVPGPDLMRDKLVLLHEDGAQQLQARLGVRPSRSSLARWRNGGYPVDRDGPRVRLPCVVRLKKVYTSTPALARWLTAVQVLSDEVQQAGGVEAWRSAKRRR